MKKQAIQKVLTIEASPSDIAHLPNEARSLLVQLQPLIQRNVLYEGVFYTAPLYFARLITLLAQPETYQSGIVELKRQQALIATMSEVQPPIAPSKRDLAVYKRTFAQLRQALEKTPPPLGTIFWHVPESGQPNGPVAPDAYLSRLVTLARSGNTAKVQAGLDEMLRYLDKNEEERFDIWFQSVVLLNNADH